MCNVVVVEVEEAFKANGVTLPLPINEVLLGLTLRHILPHLLSPAHHFAQWGKNIFSKYYYSPFSSVIIFQQAMTLNNVLD